MKSNRLHDSHKPADVPDLEAFALERTPDGLYTCPHKGCTTAFPGAESIAFHHAGVHPETPIVLDCVSEAEWVAYLSWKRGQGLGIESISADLPAHIGRETVRTALKRHDIHGAIHPRGGSSAFILSRRDVTTIEDARRVSKQLREESEARQ